MTIDLSAWPVDLAALVALAATLGWAAGLRLYATLCLLGVAANLGWIVLPEGLRVLQHPWVSAAAGVALTLEFLADKVPFIDSLWDGIHTFIRIPAGAALAAMVFAGEGTAWQVAMAILGGSLAAGTHLAKAGTRALINTSPEPLSNVGASLGEDALAVTGLWLAFTHPLVMLAALSLFAVLLAWLLPKLARFIGGLFRRRPAAAPGG